eukprot:s1842_g2.t1
MPKFLSPSFRSRIRRRSSRARCCRFGRMPSLRCQRISRSKRWQATRSSQAWRSTWSCSSRGVWDWLTGTQMEASRTWPLRARQAMVKINEAEAWSRLPAEAS